MTVETSAQDLAARLEWAREAAAKVRTADNGLTPQAKEERAKAAIDAAYADVETTASARMITADLEATQAAQALDVALAAHEAGLDFQRLAVALTEVQALAKGPRTGEEVAALVSGALDSGNYYTARALAAALPDLRARLLAVGGAMGDGSREAADLERRIRDKLADLEPAHIVAKREAVKEAENRRGALRMSLAALGRSYAPDKGNPRSWKGLDAILRPQQYQTQAREVSPGHWIVEGGAGLFG